MPPVNSPLSSLPWYHYRWPWVLMLVPFAAVLFGIFMFVTALYYPDDVVVDTYYRDGQAINQLRALDDAAAAMGIAATVTADAQGARLQLRGTDEPQLQLFLYHVTDSNADRTFPFSAGRWRRIRDARCIAERPAGRARRVVPGTARHRQ